MTTIEEIIERDQQLIGRGRWLRGSINDSLVVDKETQTFFWNSRGIKGDVIDWLTKVKGFSYKEALNIVNASYRKHRNHDGHNQVPYPALVEEFWANGIDKRKYWYKRNLNNDTIDRFRLGFFNGWYMIPIFINGEFINFQCRRDEPQKLIKYWYSGKGALPFNIDITSIVDVVVITEGLVDSILLNQFGIPSVSHTGGALGFSKSWYKYFINMKEIYYVADNDMAGLRGAIRVAKILGVYRTKIYHFDGFGDKYDTVEFFKNGGDIKEYKDLVYNNSKYIYEIGDTDEKVRVRY